MHYTRTAATSARASYLKSKFIDTESFKLACPRGWRRTSCFESRFGCLRLISGRDSFHLPSRAMASATPAHSSPQRRPYCQLGVTSFFFYLSSSSFAFWHHCDRYRSRGSCGETAPRCASLFLAGRSSASKTVSKIRTSSRKQGASLWSIPTFGFRHPCYLHEVPLPFDLQTLLNGAMMSLRSTSRPRHFWEGRRRPHHHQSVPNRSSHFRHGGTLQCTQLGHLFLVRHNDVPTRHITLALLTPRACPTFYSSKKL